MVSSLWFALAGRGVNVATPPQHGLGRAVGFVVAVVLKLLCGLKAGRSEVPSELLQKTSRLSTDSWSGIPPGCQLGLSVGLKIPKVVRNQK